MTDSVGIGVPRLDDPSAAPLFRGVGESQVQRLLGEGRTRQYVDGDSIAEMSSEVESCWLILSGEVHVRSEGNTLIVARGVGDLVGEQALIDRCGRSAVLTAVGNVTALELPQRAFLGLLGSDARFAVNVASHLCRKLRQATDDRAIRFARDERLFKAFRSHCSPEVTDRLLASRTFEEDWRPERRDLTVLFSDIRGFSGKCRSLPATEIAACLNGYLDTVVELIHGHHGMVDKFMGDGVLALFGYPRGDGRDAESAIRCGFALFHAARQHKIGGDPITIGIGVSSGEVFCGNVGNADRHQFTVLGHVVNIAARLEAETRSVSVPILICEETAKRAEDALQGFAQTREHTFDLRNIGSTRCFEVKENGVEL